MERSRYGDKIRLGLTGLLLQASVVCGVAPSLIPPTETSTPPQVPPKETSAFDQDRFPLGARGDFLRREYQDLLAYYESELIDPTPHSVNHVTLSAYRHTHPLWVSFEYSVMYFPEPVSAIVTEAARPFLNGRRLPYFDQATLAGFDLSYRQGRPRWVDADLLVKTIYSETSARGTEVSNYSWVPVRKTGVPHSENRWLHYAVAKLNLGTGEPLGPNYQYLEIVQRISIP